MSYILLQQVQEFVIEEAMKEQPRYRQSRSWRASLMLNPDIGFAERYEAVMTDMLAGRHVNQITPDEASAFKDLIDNEEPEETPQKSFKLLNLIRESFYYVTSN